MPRSPGSDRAGRSTHQLHDVLAGAHAPVAVDPLAMHHRDVASNWREWLSRPPVLLAHPWLSGLGAGVGAGVFLYGFRAPIGWCIAVGFVVGLPLTWMWSGGDHDPGPVRTWARRGWWIVPAGAVLVSLGYGEQSHRNRVTLVLLPGSADRATVTYGTPGHMTTEPDVDVRTWHKEYEDEDLPDGQTVSLTVRNGDDDVSVFCRISVGGHVVSDERAQGPLAEATCSATAP